MKIRILFFILAASLANAYADNSQPTSSNGDSVSVPPSSSSGGSSFNDTQKKDIQGIVHDYLVSQPQVLVEASQSLQKQEDAKAQAQAKTAVVDNATDIFSNAKDPVAGNPNGNVTLVEFFDYQCPHCKDMAPIVSDLIKKNPNLRVVFKELPIFGANSRSAATAALAVYKSNPKLYLSFHDALMKANNPISNDAVFNAAKELGLNVNDLKDSMKKNEFSTSIDDNFKLAQTIGILGTPSFIIAKWDVANTKNDVSNSVFIPGATTADQLQQSIDQFKK